MKEIKINIISISVILLLVLQVKCFYLIPFPFFYSINGNQQQVLMVILVIVTLIVTNLRPFYKGGLFIFNKEILFFVLYYVFELVYSTLKNKQGVMNAFSASNFYLMIMSFYIFNYYISIKGIKKFNDIIIGVAMANIVICWIQYVLAAHGIVFTKMQLSGTRFDSIRIADMSETITCLGIILATSRWMFGSSAKKNKYFIMSLLGILGNLIVSKGRISIISLVTAFVLMLLVKYKKNMLSIGAVLCATAAVVILFFRTPLGEKYITSFSSDESDTATIRNREYDYYLNQSKESISNFIFGVGFIRDTGDEASNYLKGPVHQYSRTDIGIVGVLNAIGIIGCIWYSCLLLKSIIVLLRRRKWLDGQTYAFILAFISFHLIYLPTMATLNPFSITSFVILLCYIQFIVSNKKESGTA